MHCWQLRGQEQAALSEARSGVLKGQECYWLDNDPNSLLRLLNSAQQLSLPLLLCNTPLLFRPPGKYFPHDPAPQPSVPSYGEVSSWLVFSGQFSVQSGQFFIVRFPEHSDGLFTLAHFQTKKNIFTISRNSTWAPASINFSTIAKCPSKHALWRAVRLYCRRLKQEIGAHIKNAHNPLRAIKLGLRWPKW